MMKRKFKIRDHNLLVRENNSKRKQFNQKLKAMMEINKNKLIELMMTQEEEEEQDTEEEAEEHIEIIMEMKVEKKVDT